MKFSKENQAKIHHHHKVKIININMKIMTIRSHIWMKEITIIIKWIITIIINILNLNKIHHNQNQNNNNLMIKEISDKEIILKINNNNQNRIV